jgi:hypothetical protein
MTLRFPIVVAAIIGALFQGCASPRASGILGLNYSSQPPRVWMRWTCNGQSFTTQGTGVCEQKSPSKAQVSVKIPPLEGRVVYSNGQLKKTEDFNWYPKEGFWLWQSKPIKDTWVDLDLGQIATAFGDWPVALDVVALADKVGTIVTRGILYHRVCDDVDVPCSKLVVKFDCSGHARATGAGLLAHCDRLSGGPQGFTVQLSGPGYQATPGAKVEIWAPRIGLQGSFTPSKADFAAGDFDVEAPQVSDGPTIVGIRLSWVEAGKIQHAETRILVVGFAQSWTGMDQPHVLSASDGSLEFAKPILGDVMEANLYQGRTLIQKQFSADQVVPFPAPGPGQVACAFAWQQASSDQTALCLDSKGMEALVP